MAEEIGSSTQEDGMYVRYCTKPYTRFEFKIELLT